MIAAKKNYSTQWQVVNCRVNVDGVRGILAKSQALTKRAKVRFEEKSKGRLYCPQPQLETSAV